MKLTKEQFRAQFRYGPCSFTDIQPAYEETFLGYRIYRCLQSLFLQDEKGQFWASRLD